MSDNGTVKFSQKITELIQAGALFVINSSGGKDSQAMTIQLSRFIPLKQLVIIHSHLPEVEWEGIKEHIQATSCGIPVQFTQAGKTFFEMVEKRGMFPSPQHRQCTSDLKRGPIQKFINNYCKANGFSIVVNCIGLRADESASRAKKKTFRQRLDLSSKNRTQYEWLPIHSFTLEQVKSTVSSAGQNLHFAYALGMSRLSCAFCIMASKSDLKVSAAYNPELAKKYIDLEHRLNFTMNMSGVPLEKILQA
jgi:DNA sulfur modification protein DndC